MIDNCIGLYDSDTGESLKIEKTLDLGADVDGEPLSVVYTTAKRGRIAQVRSGSLRCHYFVAESFIAEDVDRLGRWLRMNGKDAVKLIRDNAS